MIKILLLIAVIILISLLAVRWIIPFIYGKIKEDIGIVKEKMSKADSESRK